MCEKITVHCTENNRQLYSNVDVKILGNILPIILWPKLTKGCACINVLCTCVFPNTCVRNPRKMRLQQCATWIFTNRCVRNPVGHDLANWWQNCQPGPNVAEVFTMSTKWLHKVFPSWRESRQKKESKPCQQSCMQQHNVISRDKTLRRTGTVKIKFNIETVLPYVYNKCIPPTANQGWKWCAQSRGRRLTKNAFK